jgi:hypothetical protein
VGDERTADKQSNGCAVENPDVCYLKDLAHSRKEGVHIIAVLLVRLAAQAHGGRALADQTGRVGHHTDQVGVAACSALRAEPA